jgi:hypothetical protein
MYLAAVSFGGRSLSEGRRVTGAAEDQARRRRVSLPVVAT